VEVERLVAANGIITLANQAIPVGSPLAGQRARIRLDGQVMHVITQDGTRWRTLPCPVPPARRHRLQGVRLAGPEPLPPASPVIQRKVSSRGGIRVARQHVQVGLPHAGRIVTVEPGDTTLRVTDPDELIAAVPRNTAGRSPGSRRTAPGAPHDHPGGGTAVRDRNRRRRLRRRSFPVRCAPVAGGCAARRVRGRSSGFKAAAHRPAGRP